MLFLDTICTDELRPIVGFIKAVLQVIQILIPIGLIILGTIDLGRAVIASKEDEIKKHQQVLLKRAMAAVLVFLVASIVGFAMGFVGNDTWKACWTGATQCPQGYDPVTGGCK